MKKDEKEPVLLGETSILKEPDMITLADKEYDVKPIDKKEENKNKEMEAEKKTDWIMPVNGRISSEYGMRFHPIKKIKIYHNGIDIAALLNTPIKAPAKGTVFFAAYDGINGNCIRIDHGKINGKSIKSTYIHLQTIQVKPGEKVLPGQQIGLVGSTGKYPNGRPSSTGPHLHMSVYEDGSAVNPLDYIK